MRAINIEKVDYIGFRVGDLDRALGFYRVLGFKVATRSGRVASSTQQVTEIVLQHPRIGAEQFRCSPARGQPLCRTTSVHALQPAASD